MGQTGDGRWNLFQGRKFGVAILPRVNSELPEGEVGEQTATAQLGTYLSPLIIMPERPPLHHLEDAIEWVRLSPSSLLGLERQS